MNFNFTEEQELLRSAFAEFIKDDIAKILAEDPKPVQEKAPRFKKAEPVVDLLMNEEA